MDSDITVIVPHMKERSDFFKSFVYPSIEMQAVNDILIYDDKRGAPEKRNQGLAEAKTKYVFFCDDDIILSGGALDKLRDALEHTADHRVIMSYADFIMVNHPNNPGIVWREGEDWDADQLQRRPYIPAMMMVERSEFPGFDESLEGLQDWDATLSMVDRGLIGVRVPEFLYMAIYLPGDSITNTLAKSNNWNIQINRVKRLHGLPVDNSQ